MSALDELTKLCDSLWLAHIEASASVTVGPAVLGYPFSVVSGAMLEIPAPGTSGLTFKLTSDDLGLDMLIKPAFDVLFTGVATPGMNGLPDVVVWTAGINPKKLPGEVVVAGLTINITGITGKVTTNVSALVPRFFAPSWKGNENRLFSVVLDGVGVSNQLHIATDSAFGVVPIDLPTVVLKCGHPGQPPPPPNFDFDFEPVNADSCGAWRTTGSLVEFTSSVQRVPPGSNTTYKWSLIPSNAAQIVGATPAAEPSDHGFDCYIQLPANPVAFVVRLAITVDPQDGYNKPETITKDYDIQVIIFEAAFLCTMIKDFRLIPQPALIGDPVRSVSDPARFIGDPARADLGRVAIQLPAEQLIGLRNLAQQFIHASTALHAATERSLKALEQGTKKTPAKLGKLKSVRDLNRKNQAL